MSEVPSPGIHAATPAPFPGKLVSTLQRRSHLIAIIVGFVVCGLGSLYLGQDNNWDLRNYHYYNAYAFLNDRIGFDVAPAQRQSYLNPIQDIPFYLGSTYLNPRVFGFLMGGIHGLNFGILFAICFVVLRRFAPGVRHSLSWVCSALGIYAPVFVGELGASQNDTLVGLFILGSTYLIVKTVAAEHSLAGRSARKPLITASIIFGLGVGLKLTMMLYAVAAALAFLFVERTWKNRAIVILTWSVAFLVGFLATNGYWMTIMWQKTGNPFFPFYNDIFKSPWAEPRSYADLSMVPRTPLEAISRPFAFTHETLYTKLQYLFRDLRYAAMYVLVVAMGLVWIFRRFGKRAGIYLSPFQKLSIDVRFLLVFFIAAFVIWEAKFSIIRYATTLEVLAPLLLVVLLNDLIQNAGLRRMVITATLIATAVTMRPIQQPRLEWRYKFWEVAVPTLRRPQNSIIVISSPRPWAYLVPMFPPEVRWVSINNNFTLPNRRTRTQEDIRRIFHKHDGDIFLLSRVEGGFLEHDRVVVESYGFEVGTDLGARIVTKHSRDGLHLYPVRRK